MEHSPRFSVSYGSQRTIGFQDSGRRYRSAKTAGSCVEVADNLPGRVLVRDSKDRQGPALTFGPAAWRAFVGMARETA